MNFPNLAVVIQELIFKIVVITVLLTITLPSFVNICMDLMK